MHASHRVSEPDVPNAHRARHERGVEWIHMYIRVIKAQQTCNSSGPSLVPAGRSSPGMGGVNGTHIKPHVYHDMCNKDLTANNILAQVRWKKVFGRAACLFAVIWLQGITGTTERDIQNKDRFVHNIYIYIYNYIYTYSDLIVPLNLQFCRHCLVSLVSHHSLIHYSAIEWDGSLCNPRRDVNYRQPLQGAPWFSLSSPTRQIKAYQANISVYTSSTAQGGGGSFRIGNL